MNEYSSSQSRQQLIKKIVEIVLQVGLLLFIFGWCIKILLPFLRLIIWAVIIAITVFPLHKKLTVKLGERKKLSSIIITAGFMCLLLIPVVLLTESMVHGIKAAHEMFIEKKTLIPPPGEETASWPSFAQPLVDQWQQTSDDLQGTVKKYEAPLMNIGKEILEAVGRTGMGILEFILSIIIAGIFLAYATEGAGALKKIFLKLAGSRGDELASLSENTIRTVVRGVLGIAVIQTLMAAVGFLVAGVPAAGLLTFLCLIFTVIQAGVLPVVLPVAIYLFIYSNPTTAILFSIWGVIIIVTENLLKPILLGRGAPVPTLVVFLGAVGGLIASGFLGLFLGSVILSLGYKLFHSWLLEEEEEMNNVPQP